MSSASGVQLDTRVTEFVARPRTMLINGEWVPAASGKTFATYNPATGQVLANVAEGDAEDINRAVAAARAAFDTGPWRRMTPSQRGRLIWKLGDLLEPQQRWCGRRRRRTYQRTGMHATLCDQTIKRRFDDKVLLHGAQCCDP